MKFKHLICFLFGTGFSCMLQAQDNAVSSISPSEFQRSFATFAEKPRYFSEVAPPAYNEDKYRKFKKMRTTGIVLTGVGVGLITTGIVLIADGAKDTNFSSTGGTVYVDDMTAGDGKVLGGAFCVVFGGLATGGGITLWAIGNNKMKKYSGNTSIQASKNGLGLAYSF